EEIGLRITVDGREEHLAAGTRKARACRDHRRRLRHVLEELHAGDDIECRRMLLGILLRTRAFILHAGFALQQVQLGDAQRFFRKIDAGDARAARGHRLGEDAAAATDVEDLLAGEPGALVDPVQAQRIDVVQRPKLAVRVPPAMRKLAELLELGRIDVRAHAVDCPKKKPRRSGACLLWLDAVTWCSRNPSCSTRSRRCRGSGFAGWTAMPRRPSRCWYRRRSIRCWNSRRRWWRRRPRELMPSRRWSRGCRAVPHQRADQVAGRRSASGSCWSPGPCCGTARR